MINKSQNKYKAQLFAHCHCISYTIVQRYNVTIVGEHTPSLRHCVPVDLVPDPEEGVPGAGAHRHPVLGHPQARHAVIVARQHA